MSSVLVLNRFGLSSMHYPEWLGEGVSTYLLTEADAVSSTDELIGYHSVIEFDDYLYNPEVELKALELHRSAAFVEVIALSEFDLIRAARIRERCGIPGQSLESALAFRDKFAMKSILRSGGVRVADFAAVDSVGDLVDFTDRQGYPIVLKPRRGAASVGVNVVRGPAELVEIAAHEKALRGDEPADLIAESFIDHRLVHVDGVSFEGRIVASWPSHSTPGLAFHDRNANRSTMFEPDDVDFNRITELVSRALQVLPTPRVTIFHAEVFLASTGEILINEIASRMGGGRIKTMWHAAFGINLEEWQVRNALRKAGPVLSEFPPPLIGGFSDYPPPRNGVLVDAPTVCPIDGVYKFKLEVPIGTYLDTPTSIGDVIGSSTAASPTAAQVNELLDSVDRWFLESVTIDSIAAEAPAGSTQTEGPAQ